MLPADLTRGEPAGITPITTGGRPTSLPRWALVAFLITAAAYLYLILFVLPHTPIYRDGDGDLYLASARRLFDGEVMYRDFSQFTFPGTEVLYVTLFTLFGPVAWVGNFALAGAAFGLTWLTFAIARRLIAGWAACVPPLLFLTLLLPSMLDGTHHWYSVLGAIAAVAVIIENRTLPRLAAAGAWCGFSAWFTHMRGFMAVLGITIFVLWEWQNTQREKRWLFTGLACLWASFLAAVVVLNAYFIWRAGLGQFLDSTIVFGMKYYRAEHDNSWAMYLEEFPRYSTWHNLGSFLASCFVHLLLPFAYLAFQIFYRRSAKKDPREPWGGLMLLQAVGLCLFIGVAPAAESQRLATVALPATILFVYMLSSWGRMARGLLAGMAAAALAFTLAFPLRMQTRHWTYFDAPAGRVAFSDVSRLDLYQWVINHTRPGDFFLDNAGTQPFAYLAGLRPPGPTLFLTTSDYTRPEQIQKLVGGLEKHRVRYILWDASFDVPSDSGVPGDHQGPLRSYLHVHYRVVKTFPGLIQVWERIGASTP